MARISTHPIAPIIETAERWKQDCLVGDGSLFSKSHLWTAQNISQFKQYFVDNLIEGSDQTFYEKFQIQLANSPAEIKQLAAEMLYVLLLFPSNITARKKAEDIRLVWGWSGQDIDDICPTLEASFAEGIGSTGMAYNNLRWAEFVFFTTWLMSFKALSQTQRQDLVSSPWKFGNWLDGIEGADKRQLRHIVLFLLFPDFFETSSSRNQKNQLYSVFGGKIKLGDPLITTSDSEWIKKDKTIYLAREKLTEESGAPVNFYLSPYKELWLDVDDKNEDEGVQVDMRELLNEILQKYPSARANTSFGGQHEIRSLFERLKDALSSLNFVGGNPNLLVKYSYGKGNWAETPWIAILDKRETTTTQKGTYVVILFRADGDGCHLKLGQGVTEIKELYGSGASAVEELQRRADQVRAMFPEMLNTEFDQSAQLSNEKRRWRTELYEASTIYSKYYKRNEIPSNEDLNKDIETLVDCYEQYVSQDSSSEDLSETPNRKIWAISPGEGGRLWNESYEKGIISIGWDSLGDLSQYKTQDEILMKLTELRGPDAQSPTNDSLCCYQFTHEMSIGDLVIAKVGRKKILGGGVVVSDYIYDPERREYKSIRQVKWVTAEEAEFPGTGVTTKTMTEISRYPTFRELAEAYVSEKTIPEKVVADPYSYEDALKDLFLSEADLKSVINTAKRKKNIILQGPPGVGKTFVSKRLAYLLMGEKDPSRVEFVQFHQSYSYEDFVQGWRPNSDGGFNLKSGSFYEFCRKARADLSRPHVFIIDEINRGNLSKIFGELLMLIESDKRGLENAIKLTYSESEADRFSVPENIFIIGLMNTADRSLAIVDYALRRRFAFFNLPPQLESSKFESVITKAGGSANLVKKIRERIGGLNQVIGNERRDLGPGFQIGHSYFCPVDQITSDSEWYLNVINTEIKPLIEEYWFDSPEKVDTLLAQLVE